MNKYVHSYALCIMQSMREVLRFILYVTRAYDQFQANADDTSYTDVVMDVVTHVHIIYNDIIIIYYFIIVYTSYWFSYIRILVASCNHTIVYCVRKAWIWFCSNNFLFIQISIESPICVGIYREFSSQISCHLVFVCVCVGCTRTLVLSCISFTILSTILILTHLIFSVFEETESEWVDGSIILPERRKINYSVCWLYLVYIVCWLCVVFDRFYFFSVLSCLM